MLRSNIWLLLKKTWSPWWSGITTDISNVFVWPMNVDASILQESEYWNGARIVQFSLCVFFTYIMGLNPRRSWCLGCILIFSIVMKYLQRAYIYGYGSHLQLGEWTQEGSFHMSKYHVGSRYIPLLILVVITRLKWTPIPEKVFAALQSLPFFAVLFFSEKLTVVFFECFSCG